MKKAIQMTCLFISIFSQSQIDCTFNLSLIDADLEYRKIEKNEEIHIYIKNQHFLVSKSSIDFISQSDLKKINLKTINELIFLADKERKRLIIDGEKKQIIRILNNNEVFKKLYLYEIVNGEIIRYKNVMWIEEIS
jgi:hypothetical protein